MHDYSVITSRSQLRTSVIYGSGGVLRHVACPISCGVVISGWEAYSGSMSSYNRQQHIFEGMAAFVASQHQPTLDLVRRSPPHFARDPSLDSEACKEVLTKISRP